MLLTNVTLLKSRINAAGIPSRAEAMLASALDAVTLSILSINSIILG
jgi:hypothetical protein